MLYFKTNISLFFVGILISFFSIGQELPPINAYTPETYNAGDQNWAISQAKDKTIYIANNKGLLEYNGEHWQLNSLPNVTIFRSVKAINDKVYTGSYMDFGYWQRDVYGRLQYTSLLAKTTATVIEDEEFWGIVTLDDLVLFQSFERIFIFNTKTSSFRVITSEERINKIFKIDRDIYFQKNNKGLYKIKNSGVVVLCDHDITKRNEVVNLFKEKNSLLIQTKTNGFYILENKTLIPWKNTSTNVIKSLSVYSSIRLKNGTFILGTISNGIIHLSSKGAVISKINQQNGLTNNTILSVFEDLEENLWLGLDNGINTIHFNSPYRVYKDKQGRLGTIYSFSKTKTHLYLGTNQGLFYKPLRSKKAFVMVKGIKGQVWTLTRIGNTLFCGHDNGTYIIDKTKAIHISKIKGTWLIQPIPNRQNLLIQGNYKGISILEKRNNKWLFRNKVDNFDISSRYLEFINDNEVLVNHEYKGVFRLRFDTEYRKILEFNKIDIEKGRNSGLSSYNNKVYYAFQSGVFTYNIPKKTLVKDSVLSPIFSDEHYVSGRFINDKTNNKLWGFTKDQLVYLQSGNLSTEPKITEIPLPENIRKNKSGYENIFNIEDQKYLIGTKEGYLTVDLNKIIQSDFNLSFSAISYKNVKNQNVQLPLISNKSNVSLDNKNNDLQFNYTVHNFNMYNPTLYQFKLSGVYEYWSPWTNQAAINFKNLPHGNYFFSVKAKAGHSNNVKTLNYNFIIQKPWYLKPIAIVLYSVCGGIILYLIHLFNKLYFRKKEQQLINTKQKELELKQSENQRQIIEFKNKNLQLDIENKNKELGTVTFNLVKRNELLNVIKENLKNANTMTDIKQVITHIDTNLNDTKHWKLFEQAFKNVDNDFIKTLKSLHPSITPNDIRLCTYLRLNLSSKEIAPLLNISPKSVEVKRYRLRKKMNLSQNQSLSDYIVGI